MIIHRIRKEHTNKKYLSVFLVHKDKQQKFPFLFEVHYKNNGK